MADYYTNFSLVVPLPSEEAQKYALELAHTASNAANGDELPAALPLSIREEVENWTFETEPLHQADGWGIWLRSEHGGIDAVCAFIQHLLQKYNPQGRVEFEWSNDCSKPRLDAYGGGAAIITADEIKSISTGEWLHQNAA
jgi:hypothetical protein